MSRIGSAFEDCARRGEGALICYLTAGFPDADASLSMMLACVEGGADVLELGIPFSDPVADGATIQRTSQLALERGATPRTVLDVVSKVRSRSQVPIVLMGYFNPIFHVGEERFVRDAAAVGADGLIVADLPCEESSGLKTACGSRGLDLIQMVGPTTDDRRMRMIASASSGYLYLVSSLGTTGAREQMPRGLPDLISRARRAAEGLPVGVGFGVSSRSHVEQIIGYGAEGVIVGSSLLSRVLEGWSGRQLRDAVAELKRGTGRPPSSAER